MPAIEEIEPVKRPPLTGIVSSAVDQEAADVAKQTADASAALSEQQSTAAAPAATDKPTVEALPTLTEVDQPTETVEGRLTELTGGESRYVNLARDTAERSANKRGMINSAMAAGLGEEAAIKAALPIAQQDAATYAKQRELNQAEQSKFNVNQQSADLNMAVDAFRSELAKSEESWSKELQTNMELTLANEKLSNDVKIQYIQNIAQLTTDATNQITDIGLSDRTAEAQASAILRIENNRDASIAVYQDLLDSMGDWDWGTDFTPERATAEQMNYWNAPGGQQPITEPEIGAVIDGQTYEGNGIWDKPLFSGNRGDDY